MAELSSLRNALLPDNVQSARFITTHGPDLNQVSGTVYVGIHPGEEQRVLWFKIEERIYPTVYTLWRNPAIIPLLLTPGIVVQKLQGGADLMTPGLANRPPFPTKAKKDAVVAIASLDSPSVPVCVGRCEIDVSALGDVVGTKGHAVQTMHWAGDELWAYSTSGKSGQSQPEHIDGWLSEHVEEDIAGQTADMILDDQVEGGVALDDAIITIPDNNDEADEPSPPVEVVQLTTSEVDDAFRQAFLYGIHHHMTTNPEDPNYGLEYPISQSAVMATLVQPFLPTHTPALASQLQIKKTSFKNLRKFIKTLDKEKLVRSKERDGNETTIVDVDFNDHAIASFKPYRLPRKHPASAKPNTTDLDTKPTGADPSIGQTIDRKELYKPPTRLLPLFTTTSATAPPSFYTSPDIKALLTSYIDTEALAAPTNKRIITLNPVLATVLDGSSPLDSQVLAKGSLPRDVLFDRLIAACAPFHLITSSSSSSSLSDSSTMPSTIQKPKPGPPSPLLITLETRAGSKTCTRISGLEPYSISPSLLAEELRRVCAGSASVELIQGCSPRDPRYEVVVQGPQREIVGKSLERRGVKVKWVEVVDKIKKGKKR